MPNYKVFQDLPSALRSRIYGTNAGTDIELAVDASGYLGVQNAGNSLTVDTASGALDVTATNFDIRPLSNATDNILIYGYNGTTNQVVLTDASGRVMTIHYPDFTSATETVSTATAFVNSTTRDVSQFADYSFWVQNTGATSTATVQLQISPDGTSFLADGTTMIVGTSTSIILTPNTYLHYANVAYQSTTAGSDTSLTIIWQAHTV